jgi:hypothetical protein
MGSENQVGRLWTGYGYGPVMDFCEYCNEPLGSIRDWDFLE